LEFTLLEDGSAEATFDCGEAAFQGYPGLPGLAKHGGHVDVLEGVGTDFVFRDLSCDDDQRDATISANESATSVNVLVIAGPEVTKPISYSAESIASPQRSAARWTSVEPAIWQQGGPSRRINFIAPSPCNGTIVPMDRRQEYPPLVSLAVLD
jgi:hypothetical protein